MLCCLSFSTITTTITLSFELPLFNCCQHKLTRWKPFPPKKKVPQTCSQHHSPPLALFPQKPTDQVAHRWQTLSVTTFHAHHTHHTPYTQQTKCFNNNTQKSKNHRHQQTTTTSHCHQLNKQDKWSKSKSKKKQQQRRP